MLNRVELAETYINGSKIRDLVYDYDQLGNIESKTSTVTGDTDVTAYVYGAGAAGPHAVTSASIDGVSNTLTYDLNGAVTKYEIAGTSDDKYLAYNAFNQPTVIVVGSSLTDSSPKAKDEFAYGPNGQRYSRRTTWKEGSTTKYEVAYYIGPVEIIYDNDVTNIQKITKTKLSPNVMHVEMVGTVTESFFEYAHRDHLGSIEVVTDESGNKLDNLAFDPFGSRKKPDWLAKISSSELDDILELDWDHSRKVRGFTGHEHLDRTGFIHMNGRTYDPVLGRFLSPDPFVPYPASTQSWNRYSYVRNSPASFTDPSGYTDKMPEVIKRDKEPTGRPPPPYPSAMMQYGSVALNHMSSGSFRSGGQSGSSTGPSDDAIEEIKVTASLLEVEFRGISGVRYLGIVGSYAMKGVFDASGGAGVVAVRLSGTGTSSRDAIEIGSELNLAVGLGILGSGYSDGILPGFWKGRNGKWNSLSWGGNGATGPRAEILFHSRHLRLIAKGTIVLDVGFEAADLFEAVNSGDTLGTLDSAVDFAAIGIGLSGNPYAAWGAVWYGVTDATFGPWAAGWVAAGLCRLDSGCL